MLWARAASISFFTFGTAATQRGRWPQFAFMKSSTSSAVGRGSTVTGLSSGTGGSFTLVHSMVMSPALAGSAAHAAAMATAAAPPNLIANDVMGFLPWSVDGGSHLAVADPANLSTRRGFARTERRPRAE